MAVLEELHACTARHNTHLIGWGGGGEVCDKTCKGGPAMLAASHTTNSLTLNAASEKHCAAGPSASFQFTTALPEHDLRAGGLWWWG